jgi:hypothetical protein
LAHRQHFGGAGERIGHVELLGQRRVVVCHLREFASNAEEVLRRTGDLVSRVGSDTTLLRAVLTQGLVEAIGGAAVTEEVGLREVTPEKGVVDPNDFLKHGGL